MVCLTELLRGKNQFKFCSLSLNVTDTLYSSFPSHSQICIRSVGRSYWSYLAGPSSTICRSSNIRERSFGGLLAIAISLFFSLRPCRATAASGRGPSSTCSPAPGPAGRRLPSSSARRRSSTVWQISGGL